MSVRHMRWASSVCCVRARVGGRLVYLGDKFCARFSVRRDVGPIEDPSRYSGILGWSVLTILSCKPAASLLLPATLAAALWSGAQNILDVEAVRSTQLVSVDTFDSSRNAHLLTLHLPRCTHRFCMHAWTWCGQTEKMKPMATHR